MKTPVITTLFIALSMLYLSSCSKNRLNEYSPSEITADDVFVNKSGFENALNGLYDEARRIYSGNSYGSANDLMEENTVIGVDNAYGNYRSPTEDIFNLWESHNNAALGYYNAVWAWLYQSINAANTIIDRADNPNVDWTQEDRNEIVAEARCMRAWFYRHLTFMFGDVPLALHEANSPKTDWHRNSVKEVRDSMEADWLFAARYLPESSPHNGKLVRGVAEVYLSELYLTMGEPQKAKDIALKVTEDPAYALITERYGVNKNGPGTAFTDMFISGNSNRGEGNTEALWVMQNELNVTGGDGTSILSRYWINRYYSLSVKGTDGKSKNPIAVSTENGGRGIGRLAPTKYALQLYGPTDDRGSQYAWRWYWIINNEKSIPKGFHLGDTIYLDTAAAVKLSNANWPNTRKWDYANPIDPSASSQYNDLIYLRSAVAWLLLAEADLDLNDKQGAADALNVLRNRAHATPIAPDQVTLDFILDERSRELFSEEERRYTLLRTHTWLKRVQLYNPIAAPHVAARDTILPIPINEINANVSYPLPQNPGY